jgi:nucleoside-diphosphate-sugar epimerase
MKIFLTGATGVIGRRVLPALLERGYAVTAIGRSPEKRDRLQRAGAQPVDVDLLDRAALRLALDGHDVVINLATHIPSSSLRMLLPWSWRENDRVRRDGSAAIVDAAIGAGVTRVVQESFAPVYEANGDAWIDEQHPVRPVSYNRSVLDAEHSAARFAAAGRVGVVLRFAGFYGPDAFHIASMIDMVRKGWAPLPGRGDAFVSSVSHDDAASAVVASLDVPAGIYNVCDDEPLRRGDWTAALAGAFGIAPPKPMPAWMVRLGGSTMELLSRAQRISNRRLRDASTWRPRYPSAREGFRALADQMRRNASSASSR